MGLGGLIWPTGALGGAWTPERGHVNAIFSTSISQTPVDARATTSDLYYERGIGGGWALVFAPSVSDQDNVFARNEAQISLRRRLYEGNGWALSAQAGAYIWKESIDVEASTGTEYRLALGRAFGSGGWVNVETAARQCRGDAGVRFEGALGQRLRRHDRIILKVFGDGEGCAANISRVQASYVYGLSEQIGVEMGWRETLPNAGNWNERGLVVGIWLKF